MSPGPGPRACTPILASPERVCQPSPSPSRLGSSWDPSSSDQKRLARSASSAGNSTSERLTRSTRGSYPRLLTCSGTAPGHDAGVDKGVQVARKMSGEGAGVDELVEGETEQGRD